MLNQENVAQKPVPLPLSKGYKQGDLPSVAHHECALLFLYMFKQLDTCISMSCCSSNEEERNITTIGQLTCLIARGCKSRAM